jgi:RNA polymerase sigma-70 factor (ECF subfamily)
MGNPDDQEIIEKILKGDSDAYATLVARYQKAIFNLMIRMTGSSEDAADLTRETFIKAYEELSRLQRGNRFFPWVYNIGTNHSKKFLCKKCLPQISPVEDCELESEPYYPSPPEEAIYARFDAQRLMAVLNRLPIKYREAVILRYQEECSMEDIASALDLSLNEAKMHVHRGLRKTKELLEKGSGPEEDLSSAEFDPVTGT